MNREGHVRATHQTKVGRSLAWWGSGSRDPGGMHVHAFHTLEVSCIAFHATRSHQQDFIKSREPDKVTSLKNTCTESLKNHITQKPPISIQKNLLKNKNKSHPPPFKNKNKYKIKNPPKYTLTRRSWRSICPKSLVKMRTLLVKWGSSVA